MENKRIFIGTLGMDQHEVGAIAVARLLRDAGMEVLYMGRFNLPAMIVKVCLEEDVDVIGLSCHSWEYLYYLPAEVPSPELRAGKPVTEADEAFTEAQKLRAAATSIWNGPTTKENKRREALAAFRKLVEAYPQSNKIGRCAFHIAEMNRRVEQISKEASMLAQDAEIPDDLRESIEAELEENPEMPWDKALAEIAEGNLEDSA